MIKSLFCTPLILAVFLCSCSTQEATRNIVPQGAPGQAQTLTTISQAETSIVAAGDSISFSVWGYPEFTTRAVVNRFGTINVPLLGEIRAAGFGREDFDSYLRHRLAEFIKGEIKLTLEIVKPIPWILVIGAVPRQGGFTANKDVLLLEVLANAGGWNEQSDLRHLRISRQSSGGSEGGTIELNLEWYLDSGNIRSLPLLRPGDVLYVPKKENAIRETAEYLRDAFLLFGFFRLFD